MALFDHVWSICTVLECSTRCYTILHPSCNSFPLPFPLGTFFLYLSSGFHSFPYFPLTFHTSLPLFQRCLAHSKAKLGSYFPTLPNYSLPFPTVIPTWLCLLTPSLWVSVFSRPCSELPRFTIHSHALNPSSLLSSASVCLSCYA